MREEGLGFLERADKVWQMEATVAAARPEVWRAIADPTGWHRWFPGVEKAWYEGDPPFGVGTVRKARVSGHRYDEVMCTWDEPSRFAYSVTGASLPIARAQLKCTELEECSAGTRMRWIIAADRRPLLRLATPVFHRTVSRLWNRATANLERLLSETRPA